MLCEHQGMHGRASDGASNTNEDGRAKGVCIACVLCSLLIALPSIVVSSMCNGLACSAHTREDIKKFVTQLRGFTYLQRTRRIPGL